MARVSTNKPTTLLPIGRVASRLDIPACTLRRWCKAGLFPKPIFLTPGSPAKWRARDVEAFIEKRALARRPKPTLHGTARGWTGPLQEGREEEGAVVTAKARRTKAATQGFRDALYAIAEEQPPMTVRQVYYQALVRSLVPKTDKGYWDVQRHLCEMPKNDTMPPDWIVDGPRGVSQVQTFSGIDDALNHWVESYWRNLWLDHEHLVLISVEKDALASVIEPVTSKYTVPLIVCRGFSSLGLLNEVAKPIRQTGKPTFIYHLGDYDPSGIIVSTAMENDLRSEYPDVKLTVKRIAVTPQQIKRWRLPTRPTKRDGNTHAKSFDSDHSVELDAIAPQRLRDLVEEAINRHLSKEEFDRLSEIEKREREQIKQLLTGHDTQD